MKLLSLFLTDSKRGRSKSMAVVTFSIICLLYIPFEIYYLVERFGSHSQDLHLYYEIALNMTQGNIPYRDFKFEYPLFAIIPILVPQIFNHFLGGFYNAYCFFFALQNICYALATARLIYLTRSRNRSQNANLKAYLIILLFSLPIYLYRFDPFPAFLTSIAIYTLRNNPLISGMSLVAAVLSKVYPLVIAPVLLLSYSVIKDYKRALIHCGGFLLMIMLTSGIILPFADKSFLEFFEYHHNRGIQLESLAGGFLLLLKTFKIIVAHTQPGFGSLNVASSVSPLILQCINVVAPIVFLLLHIFFFWVFIDEKKNRGEISENTIIAATGSLVLSFIILNKVFSPQYVVWLFPFIPFYHPSVRRKFILALILTISIFPGWYPYLIYHHPIAVIALNVRNALLIWIMVDILQSMVRNLRNLRMEVKDRI